MECSSGSGRGEGHKRMFESMICEACNAVGIKGRRSRKKSYKSSTCYRAAQAAYSEMEAELRRLKVQSDQWRKAAEVAAAMLSSGESDKYMERTRSLSTV